MIRQLDPRFFTVCVCLFILPFSGAFAQSSQQDADKTNAEKPASSSGDEASGETGQNQEVEDNETQQKEGEAESTQRDNESDSQKTKDESSEKDVKRAPLPAGGDTGSSARETDAETPPPSPPANQSQRNDAKKSNPLAELAEKSEAKKDAFEPVQEMDTEPAQAFISEELFPHIEWDGVFRARTALMRNFDLDTRGTSLVLPPIETYTPSLDNPANSGAETLWSTDIRLRLEPTFHLTEDLRLHTEADLLDNVVMGGTPAEQRQISTGRGGNPGDSLARAEQASPDERNWTEDAVQINEVWGEADFFFGSLKVGRMDNHWGLGMFANSGDCLDCDYGDHVDRFEWQTTISELNLSAAIDYPAEGLTSQTENIGGQPYDLGQVDDIDQYTFKLSNVPTNERQRRQQQKVLREDKEPVLNGGMYFSYRKRSGQFVSQSSTSNLASQDFAVNVDPRNAPQLVYRGESLYIPDVWTKFLYNPSKDKRIRLELEANGIIGSLDNATNRAVGGTDDNGDPINCFDDDARNRNRQACTTTDDDQADSTSRDIQQYGVAFESEFHFGGPVTFGLNGGYASGDNNSNWGYGAGASNFYRFDPNYHVDLILFREVVGTVTNAFYGNPYIRTKFFESQSGDSWMDFQFDAIASASADKQGAPSSSSRWLGLEFDGALRFIEDGSFRSELEGGLLFPFNGLSGRPGNRRLTQYGSLQRTFQQRRDPSVAWTVQGNMFWTF